MESNNELTLSASDFIKEYEDAVKNNRYDDFRTKYRNLKSLKITGIEELQGNQKVQDELFYVIEETKQTGGVFSFSCGRPLSELQDFNARLIARLEHSTKIPSLTLKLGSALVPLLEQGLKDALSKMLKENADIFETEFAPVKIEDDAVLAPDGYEFFIGGEKVTSGFEAGSQMTPELTIDSMIVGIDLELSTWLLDKESAELERMSAEIEKDCENLEQAQAEYEKIQELEKQLKETPADKTAIKAIKKEIAERTKRAEKLCAEIESGNKSDSSL